MDEAALLALAAERGRVMAQASEGGGAMASIAAGPDQVEPLLPRGGRSVDRRIQRPRQTVVSGPAEAVERVCRAAAASGPGDEPDPGLARVPLAGRGPGRGRVRRATWPAATFQPLTSARAVHRHRRRAAGRRGPAGAAGRQVREPVRFSRGGSAGMAATCDLLIEVGSGRVLSGLAAAIAPARPGDPAGHRQHFAAGLLSRGRGRLRARRARSDMTSSSATALPGRCRWTRSSGSSPAPASPRPRTRFAASRRGDAATSSG